jgi:hypothetical protein
VRQLLIRQYLAATVGIIIRQLYELNFANKGEEFQQLHTVRHPPSRFLPITASEGDSAVAMKEFNTVGG